MLCVNEEDNLPAGASACTGISGPGCRNISGDTDKMYKIFIVEDDPSIAGSLQQLLTSWGHEAYAAQDLSDIMPEFVKFDPQIALLDIMLPFYNGYHWCSRIREISTIPVVFISSASDNMNIVMAMNMGGDDFISKPFDTNVLVAKLEAILRRAYGMGTKAALMEHKGVILNLSDGSATVNGNRVDLTKNEMKILQVLMENKGKIVSRDTLMTKLWQSDSYVEENTLTVNVNRLRKKLDESGAAGFIKTKVGSGYIVGQ